MYIKVEFEYWNHEFEKSENHYFKTQELADNYIKGMEGYCKALKLRCRSYKDEISFAEMKKEITLEEFEELFGITIMENLYIVKER